MSTTDAWQQAKEEIRDRVDFVSLVEEYVRLKKQGKNYMGLCPFHNEDTPSFSVSSDEGLFYCFGCGKGGDLFQFVQDIEHCDFPESVRILARRTGVELPETTEDSGGESDRRRALFELNAHAAERYQSAFWSEHGEEARSYLLEDRGFSEQTLRDFEVGYAPPGWQNMVKCLQRDGFDIERAVEAGLLGVSEDRDRVYDKFRNRIIFPIRNASERVVGFGGRVLPGHDESPKYLNSPESPVFEKRRTLYGLTRARSAMRETGRCLVMEGYTDVMKCHESGFAHSVATLGTALSEHHARDLKRYVDEIVFLFDGDDAGVRAARRGGTVALGEQLEASVVLLPEDRDPADILATSREALEQRIEARVSFLEALLDWLREEHDVDSPRGKEAVIEAMVPLIQRLPSRLRQEDRVDWLSDELGIQSSVLYDALKKEGSTRKREPLHQQLRDQSGRTIEDIFFMSLIAHPQQVEQALSPLSVKDFSSRTSRLLMKGLRRLMQDSVSFSTRAWMERIPESIRSHLARLAVGSEENELARNVDPERVAHKIRTDSARRERDDLTRALSEQDHQSGKGQLDEAKKALLRQAQEMKRREHSDHGQENP